MSGIFASNNLANRHAIRNIKFGNQGFVLETLKRKFQQFSMKYIHLWSKFGVDITSDNFLNSIFLP